MRNLAVGVGIGILVAIIMGEALAQPTEVAQAVPFEALSYCDQLDAIDRAGKSVTEFVIHSGRSEDYAWAVRSNCSWHQEQISIADSILRPPVAPPSMTTNVSQRNCDLSYPDLCLAPPPPDLDCGDLSARNFRVVGSDPHRFDGDRDGIGCEE